MQETVYREPNGEIKRITEIFSLPDDSRESVLRKRYDDALAKVFGEKGRELISIRQAKIGRNDPCPCGSGMKFKRCCEARMNVAVNTGT